MLINIKLEDGSWAKTKIYLKRDKEDGLIYAHFPDKQKFMSSELFGFDIVEASQKEIRMIGEFIEPLYIENSWLEEKDQKIKMLKKQITALKPKKVKLLAAELSKS